jgi:hypothetical protein
VPHEPRTCRRLPKEVFDRLEAGCLWNEPYRYTTRDVIGIFKPKITATALRLKPIIELEEHWSDATPNQRRAFESLVDKIQSFGFDLETCAPAVTRIQWQSLD